MLARTVRQLEVFAGARNGRQEEDAVFGAGGGLRGDRPRLAIESDFGTSGKLQRFEFPQIHIDQPRNFVARVHEYSIIIVATKLGWLLILGQKSSYNTGMARPRKAGRLRLDIDLRIPVTSEQKALISEATADEPEGFAAWARAILLEAAKRKIARSKKNGPART